MANLKISQVEKTTNMDADAYVLVVQNGKNYRMSIKEAIENFEVVSEGGKATTITEVVNTVETQAEQIDKLENIVQNINKDVAVEEDANATFDGIFTY